MRYTTEQYEAAMQADLYGYLSRRFIEYFTKEGDSLRLKSNHSISIKKNYSGYQDWATDESGSGVTFLMKYFNMSVVEAVLELSGIPLEMQNFVNLEIVNKPKEVIFPPKAPTNDKVIRYLERRAIPPKVSKALISKGLLYESSEKYHNAVFINRIKTYAEATETGAVRYRRKYSASPKEYWSLTVGEPEKSYICESCIDAISLCILRDYEPAYYISVGGCSSQQAIDAVSGRKIIAFDADEAGMTARHNNPELEHIEPTLKDWNEDLKNDKRRISGISSIAGMG